MLQEEMIIALTGLKGWRAVHLLTDLQHERLKEYLFETLVASCLPPLATDLRKSMDKSPSVQLRIGVTDIERFPASSRLFQLRGGEHEVYKVRVQ